LAVYKFLCIVLWLLMQPEPSPLIVLRLLMQPEPSPLEIFGIGAFL
jgi:hypothetical protein